MRAAHRKGKNCCETGLFWGTIMNQACLRQAEWGSAFSSMTSYWIITGHGKKNLNILTHWLPRYVAAILNLLISDSFVIDVSSIFYEIFLWLMQRILTDNKSTMVQVKTWCHQLKLVLTMAWCHQLTLVKVMAWNHQVTNLFYLNQCLSNYQ